VAIIPSMSGRSNSKIGTASRSGWVSCFIQYRALRHTNAIRERRATLGSSGCVEQNRPSKEKVTSGNYVCQLFRACWPASLPLVVSVSARCSCRGRTRPRRRGSPCRAPGGRTVDGLERRATPPVGLSCPKPPYLRHTAGGLFAPLTLWRGGAPSARSNVTPSPHPCRSSPQVWPRGPARSWSPPPRSGPGVGKSRRHRVWGLHHFHGSVWGFLTVARSRT
jgi:hypothetical protein